MRVLKTITISAVLVAGLMLAACGTVPPDGGSTTPPTTVGDKTTDAIIAGTVRACGYLPTVSTVTAIIASFISGGAPINSLVTHVAESICGAVAPKKTGFSAAPSGPPVVAGVRVDGHFVR